MKNSQIETATPSAAPIKSAVDIHCPPTPITPGAEANRKLVELRSKRDNIPEQLRNLYINGCALRAYCAELTQRFISFAGNTASGHPDSFNPRAAMTVMVQATQSVGVELATAAALLSVLEAHPDFKRASEVLPPAIEAVAAQELAIQAATNAHHQRRHELEQLRAAAKARAESEIESLPEIAAARAAFEEAAAHIVPVT